MRTLRAWFLRLMSVFGSTRAERELAAEIESHLQLHIDDNVRAGMSPAEARRWAASRARKRRIAIGAACRRSSHSCATCATAFAR